MTPWYKGFTGSIEPANEERTSYIVRGNYSIVGTDKLEITELPLKKWTRDYKTFLEDLAMNSMKDELDNIKEFHKDNKVHFVLKVNNLGKIEKSEGIEKRFKLTASISCNNF